MACERQDEGRFIKFFKSSNTLLTAKDTVLPFIVSNSY